MQRFHFCLRWPDVISFCFSGYVFFFIHQIWSQLCSSRGGTESERESWKQKWGATMQTVCARVFGSSQPEISHRRNKTCSFLLLHDCSSMTPHPSSSSQLLLLLLLTQEELFLSCCDGLSSLSLVRDGIRTNPDFQTYITTNSINVMTCEGPTKHSRGCGHVTWTYCHQLRHWRLAETHWVWLDERTWKYKLSSRK